MTEVRPIWYLPGQMRSREPHVIVPCLVVTPPYFGGGEERVEVVMSVRVYTRIDKGRLEAA